MDSNTNSIFFQTILYTAHNGLIWPYIVIVAVDNSALSTALVKL